MSYSRGTFPDSSLCNFTMSYICSMVIMCLLYSIAHESLSYRQAEMFCPLMYLLCLALCLDDCSCLNENGGMLRSWYLQETSNSSSGTALDVLTEVSVVISCRNSLHQSCDQQLPSSV